MDVARLLDGVDADGILFDLDGTLISEGACLPGAVDLLRAARGRCAIVTNDAEHTPAQIARGLAGIGLPIPASRIVAAGTETLAVVAEEIPGGRVLVMASPALRRHAAGLGLTVGLGPVDAVVIGRDRQFGYDVLRRAANAVLAGAQLFVANPDTVHPGRDGRVVPETGALAAAVLACTGPVPYRVIGKPEARLFQQGLAMLKTPLDRTVMVGDNPDTDGAGALRFGLRWVQVGPVRPELPIPKLPILGKAHPDGPTRAEVAQ